MISSVKNIISIVILIAGCTGNTAGQQNKSALNATQKEAFTAFGKVTGYLLHQENLHEVTIPHLRIKKQITSVPWQGKYLTSVISMESFSRTLFSKTYCAGPDELFRKFLTTNGWKTESLGSDHYGETEYRVGFRTKKESDVFDWIYSARDNRRNDWDLKIFILEKGMPDNIPGDCSYSDLFGKVLDYYSGLAKNIISGDCFAVNIYDPPVVFETGSLSYKQAVSFYCQFGRSGTVNGYRCFGEMLGEFNSFLNKKGYTVNLKEDLSMTGWTKTIYLAEKKGGSILFVYESESAESSGYAKIRLLK